MSLPIYKENKLHPLAQVKSIVAIAAGKGGVGKSAVAVHLAIALQKLGYSVGLMDADLYGPSLREMLPEEVAPQQRGEVIIPARCNGGIAMISMAYFKRGGEATVVRAPIANSLIVQFIRQVQWGALDFLLIDFPPGTGDIHLTLAQQANLTAALIVTTPQKVALLDVRKAIYMFKQLNIPIAGIVENMSYYIDPASGDKAFLFGSGGGAVLAKECAVPLLGSIPIDPELCRSCDSGKPLRDFNTYIGTTFLRTAQNLVEQFGYQGRNKSLNNFELIWKEMGKNG